MGTYLDNPRHLLLVAVRGGEVVATTGVRSVGPAHPPHPRWLAERYPPGTTAQIVRVYVKAEHRRHGLARTLVRRACEFAATTPGYDSIYLHTNVHVEEPKPSGGAWPRRSSTPGRPVSTVPVSARCTSKFRCLGDAKPALEMESIFM